MPTPNPLPSQGIVLSFGSSSYTARIESIQLDGPSREQYETSTLSQSSGTGRTYAPKDLYDLGNLNLTAQFTKDNPPPFTASAETITLVLPPTGLTGTYTSTTALGREAYSGFITKWGRSIPLNDKIMQDITVKLSGNYSATNFSV